MLPHSAKWNCHHKGLCFVHRDMREAMVPHPKLSVELHPHPDDYCRAMSKYNRPSLRCRALTPAQSAMPNVSPECPIPPVSASLWTLGVSLPETVNEEEARLAELPCQPNSHKQRFFV